MDGKDQSNQCKGYLQVFQGVVSLITKKYKYLDDLNYSDASTVPLVADDAAAYFSSPFAVYVAPAYVVEGSVA